jgi:uncharacterized membrane-anchored protein
LDRSVGIGYAGGSSLLLVLLVATLSIWRRALGTVATASVTTPKAEAFYWVAVLFSQTLGTALGDWSADEEGLGLGYQIAALAFAAGLAVVVACYFFGRVSHTILFWIAFILTRPLGATLGDWLDKPVADGGLALSRYGASGALLFIMLICIVIDRKLSTRRVIGWGSTE